MKKEKTWQREKSCFTQKQYGLHAPGQAGQLCGKGEEERYSRFTFRTNAALLAEQLAVRPNQLAERETGRSDRRRLIALLTSVGPPAEHHYGKATVWGRGQRVTFHTNAGFPPERLISRSKSANCVGKWTKNAGLHVERLTSPHLT